MMFRILLLSALTAPWFSAPAEIQILAVTNAASFAPGLPDKGLATIFCTGLTEIEDVVAADTVPLPLALGGVSVSVHGIDAPILAVTSLDSYQQINIQIPWERGYAGTPAVEVTQNGKQGQLESARGTWPAFFSDMEGYGIVQHADDYSLVTKENPARTGEILIAYATGLGDVTPPVATGFPAQAEPPSRVSMPWPTRNTSVGGHTAPMHFQGLAPGLVGVYQINFQVPDSVAAGDLPLAFSNTSCPPFGMCGSPHHPEPVTDYGPSVLLPVARAVSDTVRPRSTSR